MEDNLRVYLERELRECGDVLENTKFEFEASKFEIQVLLEEEVSVEVGSIGKIKNEGSVNMNEIKEDYDINFNEILVIVGELDSEYGMPVNSYEDYYIESFVNEDLTERLIIVRDLNGFEFRLSKRLL